MQDEPLDPIVWKISCVVLLGPLLSNLDSTVVNVSLSTLAREMGSPLTTIQWVVSGYLLSLALVLPLSGWLVDRIGAKRVYIACFTVFTLTSLLCGAATLHRRAHRRPRAPGGLGRACSRRWRR